MLGLDTTQNKNARGRQGMHGLNEPVIQTHGSTKLYGEVQALKPLDLSVTRNSLFGFLDPNGAGRATTMKLLLGLIHPTAGGGSIFGQDIVRDSVAIRSPVDMTAVLSAIFVAVAL